MTMTIEKATQQLLALVEQGHGQAVLMIDAHQPGFVGQRTAVAVSRIEVGRSWNHGAVLMWPADLMTRVSTVGLLEAENDDIGPVLVERDEAGFWTHPHHPEGLNGAELNEWFAANGLTYTTNYLIPPETDEHDGQPDHFAHWELRQPAGNGWFLWDIAVSVDGDAIAVWAHTI